MDDAQSIRENTSMDSLKRKRAHKRGQITKIHKRMDNLKEIRYRKISRRRYRSTVFYKTG